MEDDYQEFYSNFLSTTKLSNSGSDKFKNILVTGGAGFIASHLVIRLVKNYPNYNVIVIDKMDYCSSLKNLQSISNYSNYKFVRGDILSYDLISYLLNKENIDVVLHLAAQSHVDNSFGNSLTFTHNNVTGTHTILECAKSYGKLKLFIHMSTDEVYGEIKRGEKKCLENNTVLSPTNPYAASKAAAEFLVSAYSKSFQLPVIIVRGNNVYGPHQFPEKLIPKFITLLSKDRPVTIHGNGTHSRSFLFVTDVVCALDHIMHQGRIGEIYNIGTDFEITNLEVASKLIEIFKKGEIKYVDDRPFNDCRYSIDLEKISTLGWKPTISWETGIALTVKWYLEHENHWDDSVVNMSLEPHPRMGK